METILKQDKSRSNKEFESLLNKDLEKRSFIENTIVQGVIEEIGKKWVTVDLNLKSNCMIPVAEFVLSQQTEMLKVGNSISVLIERIENKNGEVIASFEKARRKKSWDYMTRCFKEGKTVRGRIVSKTRGGMIVDSGGCLMFLPGSQVSLSPQKDLSSFMKTELEFAIVKVDQKRGNLVCSHRKVQELSREKDKNKILSTLSVGQIVDGTVKSIVDWGAFIDIEGGLDSLLHITDCSWSRINSPGDILSVGQAIRVKITKIESETSKVSVSIKHLSEDPWTKNIEKYEINKTYPGIVTKVVPYGVFCKLDNSIEGLIHSSELSFVKNNAAPKTILAKSQKINVVLLEKDIEKRRLSLSYRLTQENPWKKLKEDLKTNNVLSGTVKSCVDYGIFLSLDNYQGLDSLIHYKDLHFSEKDTEISKYKKGMKVKFKVLEANEESSKIRGSIRELMDDPFSYFKDDKKIKKGSTITVTVHKQASNGIVVHAGPKNFSILIKKNQLALELENQRISRFQIKDKLDVVVTELDVNKRLVQVSIKELEKQQSAAAIKKYGSKDSGGVLGDILSKALNLKKKKENKTK